MKRAVALAGFLALAVALLASTGGRSVGEAHAATGTCVNHTKRVVKHVRRHGKRVRVVRPRHYWTCEEAAAAAPSAPTATAPAPSATPDSPATSPTPAPTTEAPPSETPVAPPAQPEPEANAVGVTADDHTDPYTYSPTRTQVRPGRLTVQLDNRGEDAHDMYMEKVGPEGEAEGEVIKVSTKTEPGTQTTKSVEVETGTYRMWCSFGDHAMKGMEAHITVAE